MTVAYLIDPKLRRISEILLPDNVADSLAAMRRLIGCSTLGGGRISNHHDQLWCDDMVLAARQPCFAFKLRGHGADLGPFGGRCIVIGANRYGEDAPPSFPIKVLETDVEWLDEILPELTTVEEVRNNMTVFRIVVTYSRVFGKA